MQTISYGGLGDAVIVSLKLAKLLREGNNITKHKFVESNLKTLRWIQEYTKVLCPDVYHTVKFTYDCDTDYQNTFASGKWKDFKPLNTSWHGDYHFPGPDGVNLKEEVDTFVSFDQGVFADFWNERYDIAIQCSAGVSANRGWMFDPLQLAKILRAQDYTVCIVGADDRYKDEEDKDNFVSKTDLLGSIKEISSAKLFLSLGGFHSYWSLASGIINVMLEESPEHTKHYICPNWRGATLMCKHGSMKEVMDWIRAYFHEVYPDTNKEAL